MKRNKYLILITITIFALFIRLLNIDKPGGLWYDEMNTYILSSGSFPMGILKAIWRYDFHMPLYYLYVNLWMKFFGTTDVVLRCSSLIWGVLTVPAFYFLGKTYKSEKLGYLLAFTSCLSPVLIYFSQELRFYALLLFLIVLSLNVFLKLLENSNFKYFCSLAVLNLLILYIYTMGIVFVAALNLVLFVHYYFYKKDKFAYFLRYLSIFFILSMPYLIILKIYFLLSKLSLLEQIPPAGLFSIKDIFYLFNDFFSPILTNISYVPDFQLVVNNLNLGYLLTFTMLIPTIIFSFGFLISFKFLNKKFFYILTILLSIIISDFILYFEGSLPLCLRYIIILFPLFLLICADGILSVKNKYIQIGLISVILLVYIFNIIDYKNLPAFSFREKGYNIPVYGLQQLGFRENDVLLSPSGAIMMKKYIKSANYIPVSMHNIIFLDKTKKDAQHIFSYDFVASTNKSNSMKNLIPYFTSTLPTPQLENFIDSEINRMKKGDRIFFVSDYFDTIDTKKVTNFLNNYSDTPTEREFYKANIQGFFYMRLNSDLKYILKNNHSLKKIGLYSMAIENEDYPDWLYIVYKKK